MLYPTLFTTSVRTFVKTGFTLAVGLCVFALPTAANEHGNKAASHGKHTAAEKHADVHHNEAKHDTEHGAEQAPQITHHAKHKSKGFFTQASAAANGLYNQVLGNAIQNFWQKLDHIRNVDEQNEQLTKKLAALELENATIKGISVETKERSRSKVIRHHAVQEGGVPQARTVASLESSDPELLSKSAEEIYQGALAAFVAEDFETAGKAFLHLTESPETTDYNTAETHFFAGLSLYNLGNYKQALKQFESAKSQAKDEAVAFAPRALAWMAVCQNKLGRGIAGKKTVKDLIEKFPRSKEAQRLNRNE